MKSIIAREELAPGVVLLEIEAPLIASKARAGQFVIVRIDERGERIPLTVADYNRGRGTVTIVFLVFGKSTTKLATFKEGDGLADVVGPLGRPTHIEKYGTVVLVGGGLGIAPLFPVARAMKRRGNRVISIIGARNSELLFYVDKMKKASSELLIATDDGSQGFKGFVTQLLQKELDGGLKPDLIMGIGPVVMMKALCDMTRPAGLRTIISLNPIMVDGTGMCGSCRVTVGGATKFVCVDGPDFDGYLVDFRELWKRQQFYIKEEKESLDNYKHQCRAKTRLK